MIPSVTLTALFFIVLFAYLKFAELEKNLHEKIELLSRVHGLAVAEPLWTLNIESLERTVQTIAINPEIVCAEVLEANNKLIFRWPAECVGNTNSENSFSRELQFHGEIVGKLRLHFTKSLIFDTLVRDVEIGALLFFMLVLVTSIVAFVAMKLIVGTPLAHLLDSIHAAERGDARHRVNWYTNDELGRVINAYNEMIQQVDQHTLELIEAREQAETASKIKSSFLANMSHELRTPLNAVIGITEMMREDAVDKGGDTEPCDRVTRAGKHLLSLIDNILDLSKIEAYKVELQREEIDIRKLLQEVVTTVKPLAKKNGNRFKYYCGEIPGTMLVDSMRLRQVLLNLLGNACKFTKNGLVSLIVQVEAEEDVRRVKFIVRDNGIGIPQEQIPRLFDDFAQTTGISSMQEYGGTGLGLAISQRLCNLMNSEIVLQSVEGEGSVFSFALRLWNASEMPIKE